MCMRHTASSQPCAGQSVCREGGTGARAPPSLVAQWRGRCSDKAEVVRSIRTEATMRRVAQQKTEHSSTGQDVSLSKRRSGFDSRMLHRGYGVAATLLRVRQPWRVRVPLATLDSGPVAQRGERGAGSAEAGGSSPPWSTIGQRALPESFWGCSSTGEHSPRTR